MGNKRNGFTLFFTSLLCVSFLLSACYSPHSQQTNEGLQDLMLSHKGQEREISPEEILELDIFTGNVSPIAKDGEGRRTYEVEGILLEDILQEFLGIPQKDAKSISLTAGDGYSIEVEEELLAKEIILAYKIDDQPLGEDEKPFKIVIPDVFEMYWVQNLVRIEIIN